MPCKRTYQYFVIQMATISSVRIFTCNEGAVASLAISTESKEITEGNNKQQKQVSGRTLPRYEVEEEHIVCEVVVVGIKERIHQGLRAGG